jgi:twitching motility protein PilI
VDIDHFERSKQDNAMPPSTPALNRLQFAVEPNTAATPGNNHQTALGFRVGSLGFLLDASIYCEIVDQNKISLLPNVQPWLSGVLNLRGNIVPVIDLHILLEEETTNPKNRRLLAVDRGKKTVAFWIEGYPQMLNDALQQAVTKPALPDILTPAVTAYYLRDTQLWMAIALDKLFKSLTYHTIQAGV